MLVTRSGGPEGAWEPLGSSFVADWLNKILREAANVSFMIF